MAPLGGLQVRLTFLHGLQAARLFHAACAGPHRVLQERRGQAIEALQAWGLGTWGTHGTRRY